MTKIIIRNFFSVMKIFVTVTLFPTKIHMNLPFVVFDIGLVKLFSFHHVTLHRATAEDKASEGFVFVPKLPKNILFSVQKRPKRRMQQHGCL